MLGIAHMCIHWSGILPVGHKSNSLVTDEVTLFIDASQVGPE